MSRNNDIFTPEGYFEALQQNLQAIPAKAQARPAAAVRLAPWLAVAASLALLVSVGLFSFRKTAAPAEEWTDWGYLSYLAQSLDPDGVLMEMEQPGELEDEDIIQYLLNEGISVDYLNETNYETDY
ncbi:MAG: hypothetical protein II171_01245 [Bacteroidales bacterium]|nr:hypothetical protein [Bacteroidales bacterium]